MRPALSRYYSVPSAVTPQGHHHGTHFAEDKATSLRLASCLVAELGTSRLSLPVPRPPPLRVTTESSPSPSETERAAFIQRGRPPRHYLSTLMTSVGFKALATPLPGPPGNVRFKQPSDQGKWGGGGSQ